MRTRILLLLAVPLVLAGCFPRQAHYDDDPGPPARQADQPKVDLTGPTANVPVQRVAAFIAINNPFLAPDLIKREAEAIVRHSAAEGVPTNLLVALIATESSFDPKAVSPVGARGLGQLMPETAADMGVKDPFDPEDNIRGTAKYIAYLGGYWKTHPRKWELALASYLAGMGTVGNQLKAGKDLTNEQASYVRKILQLSGRV
jgi:soluble lytic murein transglycosylase-like protein